MALLETEQLSRMMATAALSRAICTLGELGVADHIASGSPQPVAELAKRIGAEEDPLYRMMRFTASYGVFRETPGHAFDHTPLSDVLRTDAPVSFRPAAQMFHRIFAGWNGLHHAVQSGGGSFTHVYGKPLFDHIGENPELAPIFDAGMTAFHGHETDAMLEAYDFSGIEKLADIGGGNGTLLSAVLQRYPDMKGILYDLGHVVGRTRESMKSLGLGARCSLIEGNFFDAVPDGADAYLLRHIIHDWTDEQSVQILGNCRTVMPANGRILLVEYGVPGPNEASLGKDADMIMLAFPGGKERTEQEYRALFEKSGFRLSTVTATRSAVCVIEGKPV